MGMRSDPDPTEAPPATTTSSEAENLEQTTTAELATAAGAAQGGDASGENVPSAAPSAWTPSLWTPSLWAPAKPSSPIFNSPTYDEETTTTTTTAEKETTDTATGSPPTPMPANYSPSSPSSPTSPTLPSSPTIPGAPHTYDATPAMSPMEYQESQERLLACQDAGDQHTFFVNAEVGRKTCTWLQENLSDYEDTLCSVLELAFFSCPKTCSRCTATETDTTTAPGALSRSIIHAPTVQETVVPCEDSTHLQFLMGANVGMQGCSFLDENPIYKESECIPEMDAFYGCPKACGRCT